MKTFAIFVAGTMLLAAAGPKKTFTGVISDEMCGNDHKMMNVKPDSKCVTDCVKAGSKYVLVVGSNVYVLSDQKTPEKFAGQKVMVNGSLDGKTLQVDSIAAAK